MRAHALLATTTLLALAIARPAHAQAPARDVFASVRTLDVDEDTAQASVLLAWGVGSIVAGTVEAIGGFYGDEARWFGANTALWGAVNTVIAFNWYLGTRRERASILRDTSLTPAERARRRNELLDHSHTQTRAFAINAALDVFYIAGGTVLFALTDRTSDFWAGAGLAAASQGIFLLAFDLVGWGLADRRTARIESVE